MTDTTYDAACRALDEFVERDEAAKREAEKTFAEVGFAKRAGIDGAIEELKFVVDSVEGFRRGSVCWDKAFGDVCSLDIIGPKLRRILERAAREATEAQP